VTAAELLADLTRQGFVLTPEGNSIRVRPASRLPAALRQAIAVSKLGLLELLRADGRNANGSPPWDQAAADALLAELRDGLVRIERERYRGKFPPHLAIVTATGLAVCEGYVANHATEAARGWDPLKLLRDGVQSLLRIARGEPRKQTGVLPPWVKEGRR
jgi:hypothetical protein